MKRYVVFDHTADMGVEIYGLTPEELFVNASFALFDLTTDLNDVQSMVTKQIIIEGDGWDDLLVNYLREILYLFHGEGFLIKDCFIQNMSPCRLEAIISGEPLDLTRHKIGTEIKAVTYHQAAVSKTKDRWTGRVIFDV